MLFKSRCSDCHNLGRGNGLGPDLAGVTKRRSVDWLKRWIREPDKMIAEKDPVVTAMLNEYKGLAMPNLALSDTQVDEVLEYIGRFP